MGGILWFAAGTPEKWMQAKASARVLWLCGVVVLGAATYFAALWLLGFRLRDFARREKR
jgi:putative peptidoglycan lipid II flippase